MKKLIFILLFASSLFAQQKDWSDQTVNFPITKDDTTSIIHATANVDTVKAVHINRIMRILRLLENKIGLGSDTSAAASEVLIRNAGNDSTEWRVLVDGDIPNTLTASNYLLLTNFTDSLDLGIKVQAYDVNLDSLSNSGNWKVYYTNGSGVLQQLTLGANGTVLKSNGATSAPSWQTDATGAGGAAYADSITHDGRKVIGDSVITDAEGLARYQPLDATLTSIAGGTIGENLVNSSFPWSDSEVSDTLTAMNYLLLTNADDSADARITYQLTQAKAITGNWVNTTAPWEDNEVVDNVTATNYLLLTATDDSIAALVNRAAATDVDTTNLSTNWLTYVANHSGTGSFLQLVNFDDSLGLGSKVQAYDLDLVDLADGTLTASKVAGVADADYGDLTVSLGSWAVEDNSHSHSTYLVLSTFDDSIANYLGSAQTLTGDWVNTTVPWADNEVADNITASSYTLLSAVDDSIAALVNRAAATDVDTTNLSANWNTWVTNHENNSSYLLLTAVDDSIAAIVNRAAATDVDTTNLSANFATYIQNHSEATIIDIADGTIAENLINTTNPWADNEVADNITASSYLLLTATDDSVMGIVNTTGSTDLDTTNLSTANWDAFIEAHQDAAGSGDMMAADFDDSLGLGIRTQEYDADLDSLSAPFSSSIVYTNGSAKYAFFTILSLDNATIHNDGDGTLSWDYPVWGSDFDDSLAAVTSDEIIQDLVGGMVTGNTETGIAVTYEDGDGTFDFVVSAGLIDSSVIKLTVDTLEAGTKVTNTIVLNDTLKLGAPISGLSAINLSKISNYQAGGVALKDSFGLLYQPIEATLTDIADGTIAENLVNTTNPWDVNEGGSGANTFTDGGILLGSGTGAFTALGAATNGQIPIGDGTTDPVLATISSGKGIVVTNGAGTISIAVDTLQVAQGGSGAATFTDGGILLGSGTGAFTALGAATNGQIPIGDGTTDPVLATITAGKGITVTNGAGTITLATLDTLTQSWFVKDTVVVGELPGWKAPYAITIVGVSAYTDTLTTTFNLEERAAATPNTAGTDVFAVDMVAVATALDSTSFTNATFAKGTWMVPTISATGDNPTFSIIVAYKKD